MSSATEIWNGNGQGTKASPYEIWNLDRLNELHNFVGDAGAGKYFRLETDLDLTEYLEGLNWEPIGTKSEPFKGIFLGNGKKITGMNINNSSASYQGFFGCISGATIQDITIEGTVNADGYVGGIVGSTTGTSTIKNCTFNGSVTGSGSYVGGIAGFFTGTLYNVTHTGTTEGAGFVGGIVGRHKSGSLTTAENTGNVTATSSSYAGGIVGSSSTTIESANNNGMVTGKQYTGGLAGESGAVNNSTANGTVIGTNYTGGLIGQNIGGTVSGCLAKGTVGGSNYTGGLIGKCNGSVANGRHSDGNVTGTDYVGGLVGEMSDGSVTNCHTYADVTGTDNVGGIVGLYTLGDGINTPQIASSGYFGNISARQYVGGILGRISYTGSLIQSGEVKLPSKLNTYKTYGSTASEDETYQETLTKANSSVSIQNCAVVGDVKGTSSCVGGILGKGAAGEYLSKTSHTSIATCYDSTHKMHSCGKIDGITYYYEYYYMDGYEFKGEGYGHRFTYYTYTHYSLQTQLTDNYFSGSLKGTDYVGGVAGHMVGGTISRNYSYAAIEGNNQVGGIVGYMQADLTNVPITLSCNVSLNSTVTATSQAGKVYGYTTGSNLTIATSGKTINKTLNTTSLVIGGIAQETSNDAQNGTLQTQRQLLQSTAYSGLGWNFNSGEEWTSEESVSYPYKQWQTAPPTILSGAVKGSTTISGTCTDNGTVYVTIEGSSNVYEAVCSGGKWSLTVPSPLKSGLLIRAWSKNADKEQSYHTATAVSFPGSGTEADPWLVYDAYDLQGVNKAGYYKQMNDIDLASWIAANSSSKGWVPVGTSSTDPVVYDGDNHKVTGLWVDSTDNFVGLFSSFTKGTIRNLTVEATANQVKGGNYAGIVIGCIGEGAIENVTAKGNVSAKSYVGGIVGYTSSTSLKSLTYTGQLTSTLDHVGGIVGTALNGTITDCAVSDVVIKGTDDMGGLVGISNASISRCSVTGTITFTGTSNESYVAGLVAQNIGTISECHTDITVSNASQDGFTAGLVAYNSGTIKRCYTAGSVVSTGTGADAGGLVGYATNTSVIADCFSTADVTGSRYVGGIAGFTAGPITNSYATGSLKNTSDDGRAGGIAGWIEGSSAVIKGCGGLNKRIETGSNQWGFRIIGDTGNNITRPEITDNYGWDQMPILRNNATKTVYDAPYEGTAKTTAELQQQTTYEALGWDFADVWAMSANGFPVLQWAESLTVKKGDLNGDGMVSITDVVLIVDAIAGDITDDAGKLAAADVNGDGTVSITDCVAAIDLIAVQQPTGARMKRVRGAVSDTDFISASMEDHTLSVSLDNSRIYTAFQMVVSVPEGMTLAKATMDSQRGLGHQAVVRSLGGGQYLVAGFSADNDALTGHSGCLLSIATDGQATGDIVISNVEFATTEAQGYHLAGTVARGTATGIDSAFEANAQAADLYDLLGRRVAHGQSSQLKKGLYIVNGKKVIKK